MKLTRKKSGYYYVYYIFNGKWNSTSCKTKDKGEAEKFMANFNQVFEHKQQKLDNQRKVYYLIDQFKKYSETVHTRGTQMAFECTFKPFKEYFGNIPVVEFTKAKIMLYLQDRVLNSSVYMARKDLINLSSTFSYAVDLGYIELNPCKGIKRYKLPDKLPLFYSKEEAEKLLSVIDNEVHKQIVFVALYTGFRQMEILSLKWNQINFKDSHIVLDNQGHLTKSRKIRTVPVRPSVMALLADKYKERKSNYVFTEKGEPLNQHRFGTKFKSYVRRAELDDKLNFHSLRHTFASWLVQNEVPLYTVSKLLGHSNISVTEIYSHLTTATLQTAVNKLPEIDFL